MNLRFPYLLLILLCQPFWRQGSFFAQTGRATKVADLIWPTIEAEVDHQTSDDFYQSIFQQIRSRCGADYDCRRSTCEAFMFKIERRFNLSGAIVMGEELAKMAHQQKDLEGEAAAYKNLDRYYDALGNIRLATENCEKALRLYEKTGNQSAVIRMKYAILERSLAYRELEEVLPEMEALLDQATENKDTAAIWNLHARLLDVTQTNGLFEKMETHLSAIEKIPVSNNPQSSDYWYAINAARGRAELFLLKNNLDEAERSFQKALRISEERSNPWLEIKILQSLAKLEWRRQNRVLAKSYLEKTRPKADKLEMHDLLAENFELSAKYAEAEGRYKDALEFTQKKDFHKASLKAKSGGFDVQAFYLEQEKAKLETEKKIQQLQLRNSIITLILALLLAAGFVVGFYFQRKGSRKLSAQNALIQRQSEQLKSLDIAKSRFFTNVSHELRTPLTLLLGPIKSLLKENRLTEKQIKLLKMVEKSGGQLALLVNEILDLRKLEMGKMGLDEKPTGLGGFFRGYFSQFESLAEQKGIRFSIEIAVPDGLTALIDREKCRQIVYNLLSNAFKFTQKGGQIAAHLAIEKSELKMSVADSGTGIHPDDLAQVFNRFFQTNRPEKVAEGGTGIGLNLCHEYAQLFGGSISVESKLGEGSAFLVRFPVKLIENTALTTANDAVLVESEKARANPFLTEKTTDDHFSKKADGQKPTILLVEDNVDLQAFIRLLLADFYEIVEAENGLDALEKLKTCRPALILSDLMMPLMDGYQLLEKVKSGDATRHIPFVLLTARADHAEKLRALRIGVDDYLFKPFDEEELLARIENLLKNQTARRSEILAEAENGATEKPLFSEEDTIWLEGFEGFVRQKMASDLLSVPMLAQQFLMSESTLLRQLKRLTGLSPVQYLQEMRLDEGRQMLENRRYNSIAQVAEKVGFGDANSFSRSFRKRFGKSPSDFLED